MLTNWTQASYRNRDPILGVLRDALPLGARVLEIGSGGGHHAHYFASHLPNTTWQPSERPGCLEALEAVGADGVPGNLLSPIEVDLLEGEWPEGRFDAIVAINVLHIAPAQASAALFSEAASVLNVGGVVVIYGPFRYRQRSLEPSNERFDAFLRARDPESGLRIFEEVDAIARRARFELVEDRALPANNRGIWWRFG